MEKSGYNSSLPDQSQKGLLTLHVHLNLWQIFRLNFWQESKFLDLFKQRIFDFFTNRQCEV